MIIEKNIADDVIEDNGTKAKHELREDTALKQIIHPNEELATVSAKPGNEYPIPALETPRLARPGNLSGPAGQRDNVQIRPRSPLTTMLSVQTN